MSWEAVIGLEVHAQLRTATKLFCGCRVEFGSEPNTHVCPVCLGMPGVLPVLNERAVELAVRTALATGGKIQRASVFARKNYFYPDLPKGYQISQYDRPFSLGGGVPISAERTIPLTRIHMEEDAGKLVHASEAFEDSATSHVDLNRAGVPLVEIVTDPALKSPEEAGAYLRALRSTLVYLGVSNADLEKGEFRCDANVSVRPTGQAELGTKVELKNMNSFRFIEKALTYEIERQTAALADGDEIVQETRLWNEDKGVTFAMRSKEQAHDYRYFPDPDLIDLHLDMARVQRWAGDLPETGQAKVARYRDEWGLSEYDAGVLTSEPATAAYFEAVVEAGAEPKAASNWVMGELAAALNKAHAQYAEIRFKPADLADLLKLVSGGVISGKIAKDVFSEMFETGTAPSEIVKVRGLEQLSDPAAIEALVNEILEANPDKVEQYRAGKDKLLGFFVGQVMRANKSVNPQVVNEVLLRRLASDQEEG